MYSIIFIITKKRKESKRLPRKSRNNFMTPAEKNCKKAVITVEKRKKL